MAYLPPRDPTAVLGRRVLAYLIDLVLGVAISIPLLAATRHKTYRDAPRHACTILRDQNNFHGVCVQLGHRVFTWNTGAYAGAVLFGVVVGIANLVVLQGLTGASIGKWITGLRVVDAQGQIAGLGRATLRWLLLLVDSFCFLGFIVAAVTHPHRRVGDMAAGTYVVATADVGRPLEQPRTFETQYAYATPGAWAPPTAAQPAPGWAPPAAQPSPYAPPTPYQQPPPYAPPPYAPPPAPQWGQPAPVQPSAPPTWGAPPPSPPSQWGTPPPQPSAPPPSAPPPQAPSQQPQAPAPPPTWSGPASEPPPPPPPPRESAPPQESAPPKATGESWWSRALEEEPDDDRPEG